MNYREARQLKEGPKAGKWHYTNRRDNHIYPDGACAHDCKGHDTPEEAYEHERQRLVASMQIGPLGTETLKYRPGQCQIEGCENIASHEIHVPGGHMMERRLCTQHANPTDAATLIFVGQSFGSW